MPDLHPTGVPIHIADTFTDPKAPPVTANYIALMHPGVGAALTGWLEDSADGDDHGEHNPYALAVARQVLGVTE